MKIINLNDNVLAALEFFIDNRPPRFQISKYNFPFVIGSEGAFYTGQNLFAGRKAVFASESNFNNVLKAYKPLIKSGIIKQAVVISASGEKDAVWEIKLAKRHNLKTTLLTCSLDSTGAKMADEVISYRKIAEPYTYNFSTYSGMLFSVTREDPGLIKKYLKKIKPPKNYEKYLGYSFILPDRFMNICPMINTKAEEMFGRFFALQAFSEGRARHAKYVIQTEKELVIGIGVKNVHFGKPKQRWNIPLPDKADMATILSISYYLVGLVQKNKPPYFKKHINGYCKDYGPSAYGKNTPFNVIVPGN